LGPQVFAELVAQVLRRVALGEHGGRRAAVDRAVVGRDQHADALARRFLQQGKQRRTAEPLLRQLAKRELVARDLVEDRRLGAPVRQQIHEVEYERRDAFRRDRPRETALEVVALGRSRDLLVANRQLAIQLDQLRLEKLALVRVERFVLALPPPIGESRRDL